MTYRENIDLIITRGRAIKEQLPDYGYWYVGIQNDGKKLDEV